MLDLFSDYVHANLIGVMQRYGQTDIVCIKKRTSKNDDGVILVTDLLR